MSQLFHKARRPNLNNQKSSYLRLKHLVSLTALFALVPTLIPNPTLRAKSAPPKGRSYTESTTHVYTKHSPTQPEDIIRRAIETGAAQEILLGIYCFTSKPIEKSLKIAADRGTKIVIIADWRYAKFPTSVIPGLAKYSPNISVYVVKSKTQHQKAMCILYENGSKCVLTGSYNYSARARKSDETLISNTSKSLYASTKSHLENLITRGIATPFSEEELLDSIQKYEARKLAARAQESDDDEDDESENEAAFTSPRRRVIMTPSRPSPSSLPRKKLSHPSPMELLRSPRHIPQKEYKGTVLDLVAIAQKIYVLMYNLSETGITDALIAAHNRGAEIEVVTDRLQSVGISSQTQRLLLNNIPTYTPKSTMHCKVLIIETLAGEHFVIDGSANLSARVAKEHNIEHSVELQGEDAYRKYLGIYLRIRETSTPLMPTTFTPAAPTAVLRAEFSDITNIVAPPPLPRTKAPKRSLDPIPYDTVTTGDAASVKPIPQRPPLAPLKRVRKPAVKGVDG